MEPCTASAICVEDHDMDAYKPEESRKVNDLLRVARIYQGDASFNPGLAHDAIRALADALDIVHSRLRILEDHVWSNSP